MPDEPNSGGEKHYTMEERWALDDADETYIWSGGITHPQCHSCLHWMPDPKRLWCVAYPGGVPVAIMLGQHGHRHPYPGDQGIRFTAMEPEMLERKQERFRSLVKAHAEHLGRMDAIKAATDERE